VRATILAAGGLACAGAAMTIAAFAGGGSDPQPAPGAPARAPAQAQAGLDVWIEQGCGSCHTFEPAGSSAPIGPDLQQTLRGKSRDYVLQSIVVPNAEAAAGYTTGMMPADYAQRIAPPDLDPLVDFLMEGARQ
jgi:mono/diheme cytochrome c family protein